jgi:hypothetical protein
MGRVVDEPEREGEPDGHKGEFVGEHGRPRWVSSSVDSDTDVMHGIGVHQG